MKTQKNVFKKRHKIFVLVFFLVLITTVFIFFSIRLKKQHTTNLIKNLKSRDVKIAEASEKELIKRGVAVVEPLVHSLKYDSDELKLKASRSIDNLGAKHFAEGAVIYYKEKSDTSKIRIIRILGSIRDKRAVEPLLEILKASDDDKTKLQAVQALGKIGDERAGTPIAELMVDMIGKTDNFFLPHSKYKIFQKSLGQLAPSSTSAILGCIAKKDKTYCRQLSYILFEAVDEKSIDLLLEAARKRDKQTRVAAVNVLSHIYRYRKKDERIVEVLIDMLNDPDKEIQSRAADGLREVKDERKIAPLVSMLRDKDKYYAMPALLEPYDERVIPHLLNALSSKNVLVKKRAYDLLLSIVKDDNKVEEIAIQMLYDDKIEGKGRALQVLREKGTKKCAKAIIYYTESRKNPSLYDAFEVIKSLEKDFALETFIGLLQNKNPKIKKYAILYLGELGDERAVPHLKKILDIENKKKPGKKTLLPGDTVGELKDKTFICKEEEAVPIIPLLLRSLGNIGTRECMDIIVSYSKNKGPKVRVSVINSLNDIDDERKAKIIQNAFFDENMEVRLTAIGTLRKFPAGKLPKQPILKLLKDKNFKIRFQVLDNLRWRDEKWIAPLLAKHAAKADFGEKLRILWILKHVGNKNILGFLKECMKDNNDEIRARAVEVMGVVGGKEEVDFLMEAYKKESRVVRLSIINSLGFLEDKRAVPLLIEALKDKMLKNSAAYALGLIGDNRAVLPIAKCLDSANRPRDYVEILGKMKDEQAVAPLLETMKMNDDIQVRSSISVALSRIKSKKAVEPLIEYLQSDDYSLQYWAADALGKLGDKRAVEPLVYLLENDSCDELTRACLIALKDLKDKRALPYFLEFSNEGRAKLLRYAATMGLGEIGGDQAVEKLIKLLDDKNPTVREYAIESLGKLKEERALDKIIPMAEDKNTEIRWAIANALGNMKTEKGVDILLELLKDNQHGVRFLAMDALAKIQDKRAVKPLLEYLEHKDNTTRLKAASALYVMDVEEGREYIINGLQKKNFMKWNFYLLEFLKVAKERDLPLVLKYLDSNNPAIREKAVKALGRIGTPEAVQHIKKALKDKRRIVREAAMEQLSVTSDR